MNRFYVQKDLLNTYFLEMVCFLNGFEDHPSVPLALDIHPIAAELCDVTGLCVESFKMSADNIRRYRIYSALLSFATDSQRHEVTKRLLNDFLQAFLPSRQNVGGGPPLDTPLSRSSGGGRAMSDVLTVLASSDLKLTFASATPSEKAGLVSDTIGEEDVLLQKEQRARFNRAILKQYLSKSVSDSVVCDDRWLRYWLLPGPSCAHIDTQDLARANVGFTAGDKLLSGTVVVRMAVSVGV